MFEPRASLPPRDPFVRDEGDQAGRVKILRDLLPCQAAPVFALMRALSSIARLTTTSAWAKSLKTRIVVVGGLRIIALGARLKTDR
jgi:hypothetical protein